MNASKQHEALVKLCTAALMTAIVFAGNYLRITMPVAVGGVTAFTLANILCALSGLLLGPWWGFLSAGLGSFLYDLTNPNYVAEAPITLVTKGMYGLVAGLVFYFVFVRLLNRGRDSYPALVASTACAAVGYLLAYSFKNFFYNGMFIEGYTTAAQCWAVVAAKLPATVVNGALAVIFAPILGWPCKRPCGRPIWTKCWHNQVRFKESALRPLAGGLIWSAVCPVEQAVPPF